MKGAKLYDVIGMLVSASALLFLLLVTLANNTFSLFEWLIVAFDLFVNVVLHILALLEERTK